ncbi:protein O-mannosyl-transferase TMTC2-like [Paramacrobiotus metropolitanus]|uniref:protein O-mannosyl-transferase TMTC2-like n=1 Tax=Paramacrobiotus metropolitanus TaxID=2943436 RepID=UPI00244651C9|nr:protein O-mannosyl-transferase TMTC2-like [Paramacrobiotus metropolitanus]
MMPIYRESFLIPILAGAVYWNTLDAEFAYDDNRAILDNQDLLPDTPFHQLWLNDFWGTKLTLGGSHKSFRPLCVATFRLNFLLHGYAPAGYHALNVLLHMLATFLLQQLLQQLSGAGNRLLAALAGLSFAVHPVHTEAVAGVVGRADVGAGVLFLLSLLAYIRYCQLRDQVVSSGKAIPPTNPNLPAEQPLANPVKDHEVFPLRWLLLIATCACATCACLFKETGITVLGVCIIYDVVVIQGFTDFHELASLTHKLSNKRLEGVVCLLGWMGVVVGARIAWMGNITPVFAASDNPAADSPSWLTRTLTFFYLPVFNFQLLLYPWTLSYDWSMGAVALINTLADRRNILSIAFYAGLVVGIKNLLRIIGKLNDGENRRAPDISSHKRLVIALAILILAFLPASNLFFYVGFVIAERILYIPSMGFSWMMAEGLIKASNIAKSGVQRRSIAAGICLLLCCHSLRTWRRNADWETEEQLYIAGAAINPAKSWSNLGNIWNQRGKLKEAEVAYITALNYRPNMADTHYNLGRLLQDQRRYNESIASYRNAIYYRHNMAVAYLNLGIAMQSVARHADAKAAYRQCAQLDTGRLKDPKLHESAKITCLFNLGRLAADEQQYQATVALYNEAVNKMPAYYAPQSLYNMLGEAYFHLNESALAELWYKRALKAKPDHVPAHLTYARFLYKQNRTTDADQIFTTVFHAAPNDSAVYHFYGQYLMDTGRQGTGIQFLLKAAEMYPNDFQSLTVAAGALRQFGDNIKSEYLYRRAVEMEPFQVSGWINLGAILHLNGQWRDAEQSYRRALQLDPHNQIAMDNFNKLQKLMLRHNHHHERRF